MTDLGGDGTANIPLFVKYSEKTEQIEIIYAYESTDGAKPHEEFTHCRLSSDKSLVAAMTTRHLSFNLLDSMTGEVKQQYMLGFGGTNPIVDLNYVPQGDIYYEQGILIAGIYHGGFGHMIFRAQVPDTLQTFIQMDWVAFSGFD